jgi:Flp pilus assembly protein TadD
VKIDVPAAESYGLFDRAWALAQKGDDEAAIAGWKKVLAINPRDAKAHNNLGVSLSRKGRFDEAVPHFEKALEINPEYQEVHTNLGRALIELGRFDQAISHFRKVLEANARQPEAHNGLGVALMREGKIGEAIVHWEKAIELDDAFVQAHYNLGNALYYLRGDARQALTHWRKVLSLEPDHLPVLNQAAWVLATSPKASLRNSAEAIQFAQRARQLTAGREPAVLDTLAAAYAEAGRFPEAVESARQALALARQQGKRPLAEALQGRLALYEARTPCRQTQQALAPRP